MKIPQSQYLHNQSFNSKFAEFVWQFPENQKTFQVIFITFDDGRVYQESGYVDNEGNYTDGHSESASVEYVKLADVPMFYSLSYRHISTNELTLLRKEAIEFLTK